MKLTNRYPGVKIITQAVGHIFSIETCRQQCEVVPIDGDSDAETHPDDALILDKLDAAVEYAEDFTGLSIAIRTYEMALDEFPDGAIEIPMPPLIEVIAFYATNDSDGVVDADDYVLDDYGSVARLRPTLVWPSIAVASPNAVKLQFRAGYSTEGAADSDAQQLPAGLKHGILLLLAHLYKNRESSTDKALENIPLGVDSFLRPKRVRLGFA